MSNEEAAIQALSRAIENRRVVRLTTLSGKVTVHPLLCGQTASGVVQLLADQVDPQARGRKSRIFFLPGIESVEVLEESFSGGIIDDRLWRQPLRRIFSKVPVENPCWMFEFSA